MPPKWTNKIKYNLIIKKKTKMPPKYNRNTANDHDQDANNTLKKYSIYFFNNPYVLQW